MTYELTSAERLYGDAQSLPYAVAAAKYISKEDGVTIAVVRPDGNEVAWATDGEAVVLQGARR